jgi:hypothetical protein
MEELYRTNDNSVKLKTILSEKAKCTAITKRFDQDGNN